MFFKLLRIILFCSEQLKIKKTTINLDLRNLCTNPFIKSDFFTQIERLPP